MASKFSSQRTAPAPGVLEITQTDNQDFERIFVLEGTEGNSMNLLSVEYNPDFTLDDMEIFSASRMDDILAGPVTDIANAVMVNGKTYALTEDNDVALFTFNADGTLLEVAEFFEGDSWEFYQDEGYWIIDADGVFSVAWPDGETEDLSVLSGLGGDTMSLQYTDDDGTVGTDTLTRVVAFDASTVAGAYDIVDASGSPVGEVLTLFEGGGGFYQDDESGEDLTWVVNADGQLVFTLYGGSGTDVETDNFYLLSDSTADNLHVIRVFRVNGQLEGDADFPGEAPEAVLEMNFARQQQ